MRLGIFGNPENPRMQGALGEVATIAGQLGFDLFPTEVLAGLVDWSGATLEGEVDRLDAILTLGGDGTMLRAARIAGGRSFPSMLRSAHGTEHGIMLLTQPPAFG